MTHKVYLEIIALLKKTEERFQRTILTTNDFEQLSVVIFEQTKEQLSSSTLKRLWGYVTDVRTPRLSTLDILSRYCGFAGFENFCTVYATDHACESQFFSTKTLRSADMKPNELVEIGWMPDRSITLRYLDNNRFEVIESHNAKLHVGDTFTSVEFIQKKAFYASLLERNGEAMPNYMAGMDNGLAYITRL